MTPVHTYHDVDRTLFDAVIRPAGRPAVLMGLGRDWPVVHAARAGPDATVDYLKRFSHPRAVDAIVGAPEIEGRFFYTDDLKALNFTRGRSPLDPFLDRLLRDRDVDRPYAVAVQSIPAEDLLPGFTAANATDLVDASVSPRLWLGNAIRVATHYDLKENIGVVVAGRRRFTLFPPDQIGNLYMGPFELTPAGTPISLVDPAAPDLARFPRFAEALAHAQTATLAPGDAIYIPYHWWHAVDSLEPVNVFMNYWWDSAPATSVGGYDALFAALLAIRTMPDDQRSVWRMLFDHFVFRTGGDPVAHLPPDLQGILGEPDAETINRLRATLLRNLSPSP